MDMPANRVNPEIFRNIISPMMLFFRSKESFVKLRKKIEEKYKVWSGETRSSIVLRCSSERKQGDILWEGQKCSTFGNERKWFLALSRCSAILGTREAKRIGPHWHKLTTSCRYSSRPHYRFGGDGLALQNCVWELFVMFCVCCLKRSRRMRK